MKMQADSQDKVYEILKAEFERINQRNDGRIKTVTEMENTVTEAAEKFRTAMMNELRESQAQICVPKKKTVRTAAKNGNLSATETEPFLPSTGK